LRNVEETSDAIGDTKDDRVRALGIASIGMSGYSAYQDIAKQAATQNPDGTRAVSMGACADHRQQLERIYTDAEQRHIGGLTRAGWR
jgi:hypothetical protein